MIESIDKETSNRILNDCLKLANGRVSINDSAKIGVLAIISYTLLDIRDILNGKGGDNKSANKITKSTNIKKLLRKLDK